MCELIEAMRQHSDTEFITLLNNLRVGILTERDRELLESRKTTIDQSHDETVLFAENMPKENYNNNKLDYISHNIFTINFRDQIRQDVPEETVGFLKGMLQSKTGGLSEHLVLKKGARVMVTGNIDRLIKR